MNFEFDAVQLAVRDKVRAFAASEVAPLARETDESGEFPIHLVKRMGELGFLAGPIPAEYGGSEMDYVSYTILSEELGRARFLGAWFPRCPLAAWCRFVSTIGAAKRRSRNTLPMLATGGEDRLLLPD